MFSHWQENVCFTMRSCYMDINHWFVLYKDFRHQNKVEISNIKCLHEDVNLS